jgi:ABC-2 type transport system permease protein
LFAAVGSVVNEDPQDAQSLMFPITMPIIFSYIITNVVIQNPNTPMAFWASVIPFSSPMVMMARISYGVPTTVPYWELALSMVTLIGGFLLTTWLSAKIYRTGILMYGKKVTWKEMTKWAFSKSKIWRNIFLVGKIVDYSAIRTFTPALVLVIGGADEIYGVAFL